jgi:hypothetical protein
MAAHRVRVVHFADELLRRVIGADDCMGGIGERMELLSNDPLR